MVLRPDIFIGALIGALTAITAAAPLTLLRALPRRTAAPLIRTTCGVLLGLTLIGIVYGVVGVGVGGGTQKSDPSGSSFSKSYVSTTMLVALSSRGKPPCGSMVWTSTASIPSFHTSPRHATSPRTPSHGVTAMRRAPAFQHQAPRALHLGSSPSPTSSSGRGLWKRHEFSKVGV